MTAWVAGAALLAGTAVLGTGLAVAGPPPASCGAPSGCNLSSDLLVFGDGDPDHRVIAQITDCGICSFPPPISPDFEIFAAVQVAFGPYDPAINLCPPGSDVVPFNVAHFALSRRTSAELGTYYVPRDPGIAIPVDPSPALRTACVAAARLDYALPRLLLSGAEGARSAALASPEHASLTLPEPVRAVEGGTLLDRLPLDSFRLTQDLRLNHARDESPLSTLRFWPDGLPIRIGPDAITFSETQVTFTAPGPPSGPAAYAPAPPPASNLAPAQVLACAPGQPDPGESCTGSRSIGNAGYFDAAWSVSGSPRFDVAGFDVDLALAGGTSMLYETLFPAGVFVRLDGPATLEVRDSRIASGDFAGGRSWLRIGRDPCGHPIEARRFDFTSGGLAPRLGADDGGSLLAGILDLNPADGGGQPQPIRWTYNEAGGLGCGTLFVPAALTLESPQRTWLASAVPTVLDRGIYAGVNFNRNKVCALPGQPPAAPERFCAGDADCTGPGEACVDGGFAPLCPQAVPATTWKLALVEDPPYPPLTFSMNGEGDREMALVARASGVTGVFDAGDDLAQALGDAQDQFEILFDSLGHAFKRSRSERADTITTGDLVFPWPTDSAVPLVDMQVCNCGNLQGGRTPDVLIEKTLAYWDAPFIPYGVTLAQGNVACAGAAVSACEATAPVDKACIEALAPVPRFDPVPVVAIEMRPDGQAGPLTPYVEAHLHFDRDVDPPVLQKPYLYDVDHFNLSDWQAAGSPAKSQVLQAGQADFGYYDARGELLMPLFGTTRAGTKIERQRAGVGTSFLADLHADCDESADPGCAEDPGASFVRARHEIAADNVRLPFRVDYFGAGVTTDPDDGKPVGDPAQQDADGASRGTLFAFAPRDDGDPALDDDLDLGSIRVAAGMMIRPDDASPDPAAMSILAGGADPGAGTGPAADVGPAASMRLWAAAAGAGVAQLAGILPAANLTPAAQADYAQAIAAAGLAPGWYATTTPAQVKSALHAGGGIEALAAHADAGGTFNVESDPPGLSPPLNARGITGALTFAPDAQALDLVQVASDLDTGGEFFALDAALLTVDRHVEEGGQPITGFSKESLPGASSSVTLPAKQEIPFAGVPGLAWDFDYDIDPAQQPPFRFRSLTGSVDLAAGGGISGVGLEKLGAGLKFWSDGDWYFTAGLLVNFDGNSASGDILLGNTKDMTPLQDIDGNVADFLDGIPAFDGGYVSAGASANVWDWGCMLRVTAGGQVAGWYLDQSFGGKVRGYVSGEALCSVSLKGNLALVGGVVNDLYKLQGSFWLAGGAGFCDEDEWYTPEDVLDDDFCAACVAGMTGSGHYPPKDMNITFKKDYLTCAGP